MKLAFTAKFSKEWLEACYADQPDYWRTNWHLEHHMFATVPCYNLARLHRTVAADMPRPRTLAGAWKEMRLILKKQCVDPSYQFDTPLPGRAGEKRKQDTLEASIGDLAPKSLE